MRGTSHLATGMALGATVAALTLPLPFVVPCAVVAGIGALSPDLDTPRSIASKALPPLSWAVRAACLGRHRTLTHWLPLWVGLSYMAIVLTAPWTMAQVAVVMFCAGYLLHLLEDALTFDGIPLLLPVGHWHLLPWPLRFRSGGRIEPVIVALLMVACLVIVTEHYIPQAHTFYASLAGRF